MEAGETALLSDVPGIPAKLVASLQRGEIARVSDLLLMSPENSLRKAKLHVNDLGRILDAAARHVAPILRNLDTGLCETEKFTTGDSSIDTLLGGGVRTGLVWELSGESGSGKTQLALQLALLVQRSAKLGGISGSCCYLTTVGPLETKRLVQLSAAHPLLAPDNCCMENIHTLLTPTVPALIHTLTVTLPALQQDLAVNSAAPVRLLVLDSIAALFREHGKTSSSTLFDRSKDLVEISGHLHRIAVDCQLAVVVVNDVTDVFTAENAELQDIAADELLYREQAGYFNTASNVPAEDTRAAALGLVWANQINVRILMTKTNRRRIVGHEMPAVKRAKGDEVTASGDSASRDQLQDEPVRVRNLSIVFSSVSRAGSLDYVISEAGVSSLTNELN